MSSGDISSGLSSYSGSWDQYAAGHLLRRTLFGPRKSEIEQALSLGLDGTIIQLLDTAPLALDQPVNYYATDDPNTPKGESWIQRNYSSGKEGIRKKSYRAWRIGTMLDQEMTIHQRLALFWFNHFAMEADVVNDTRGMYELFHIFYEEGLGSFKSLVDKVTVSHSMLIYLNGNTNTAKKPNENYARELFELFTVGKGPLIAEGDYTHYTEHDIQQAAAILSGYRTSRNPIKKVTYDSGRHNKESKRFSYIFNETVIDNHEATEYKKLIDMIFEQDAAPKHICRKLYRWFVHHEIGEAIETHIIQPLAQLMIDNNFQVKPVLEKLLSSEHFFDQRFRGTLIKSPLDYTIGIQRQLEISYPPREEYESLYKLWMESYKSANEQLQSVSDAPDVAGWPAYYQKPAYYRSWISSVNLLERNEFSDAILTKGLISEGKQVLVNPFDVFNQFENRDDPNEVVRQFAELLLPVQISEDLKNELKEVIIPGLPDFEWTIEYNRHVGDPGDPTKKRSIASKLVGLVVAIKNLPHFQLS